MNKEVLDRIEKFEYLEEYMPTFSTSNYPDMEQVMKLVRAAGKKGWELVQILVEQRSIIYKRKINQIKQNH